MSWLMECSFDVAVLTCRCFSNVGQCFYDPIWGCSRHHGAGEDSVQHPVAAHVPQSSPGGRSYLLIRRRLTQRCLPCILAAAPVAQRGEQAFAGGGLGVLAGGLLAVGHARHVHAGHPPHQPHHPRRISSTGAHWWHLVSCDCRAELIQVASCPPSGIRVCLWL